MHVQSTHARIATVHHKEHACTRRLPSRGEKKGKNPWTRFLAEYTPRTPAYSALATCNMLRHTTCHQQDSLMGLGVLGHSLGALRHGVLGQLTRKQQTHSSLHLAGSQGAVGGHSVVGEQVRV